MGTLRPEVTNFCFGKIPKIGVKAHPPDTLPDFMCWTGRWPPSILGRVASSPESRSGQPVRQGAQPAVLPLNPSSQLVNQQPPSALSVLPPGPCGFAVLVTEEDYAPQPPSWRDDRCLIGSVLCTCLSQVQTAAEPQGSGPQMSSMAWTEIRLSFCQLFEVGVGAGVWRGC